MRTSWPAPGAAKASSRCASSSSGAALGSRDRAERRDDEHGRVLRALDTPRGGDRAVDQHHQAAEVANDALPVLVGEDAGAVIVRDEDVVELGQEPRRRRRVRIGQRAVRHVEELAAALVAERAELGSQPIEDLPDAGEAGPRPHVGRGGGTERREVAQHEVVGQRVGLGIAAEPVAHRRPHDACPLAPHTPRGGIWTIGTMKRTAVARAAASTARPSFPERRAECGGRPRLLLEECPPGGGHGLEVDARRGTVPTSPPPDRNRSRIGRTAGRSCEAVARRHEVQRHPHQRHPHDLARGDHAGQLLRVEALEPAPQADVGSVRHLRLHADEPFDHVAGRGRRSRVRATAARAALGSARGC